MMDHTVTSTPEWPTPDTLLSVQEAAAGLRISKAALYRAVKRREIDALRFGRVVRIPSSSILDYIRTSYQPRSLSEGEAV